VENDKWTWFAGGVVLGLLLGLGIAGGYVYTQIAREREKAARHEVEAMMQAEMARREAEMAERSRRMAEAERDRAEMMKQDAVKENKEK
jgi:hypothetical protein